MQVTCKNCGEIIEVNGLGRKRLPILFNNVSSALQHHSRGRLVGKPHYLNTSKKMFELFGLNVTAGFVQWRLQEEARNRGMDYNDFLAQLVPNGEVVKRKARIKKVMRGKI